MQNETLENMTETPEAAAPEASPAVGTLRAVHASNELRIENANEGLTFIQKELDANMEEIRKLITHRHFLFQEYFRYSVAGFSATIANEVLDMELNNA